MLTRVSDLVQRIRAIALVQGTRVVIQKVVVSSLAMVGVESGNDIVPYLRQEANKGYRTYIDVGAFIGDTLIPISRLFNKCIAVEPDPRNIPILQKKLKSMMNCAAVGFALSELDGLAAIYSAERADQTSLYGQEGLLKGVQVRCTTLDAVASEFNIEYPCLIKMDVQGNEIDVLKGGRGTIRNSCVIFSEFWPAGIRRSGHDPLELLRLVTAEGFRAFSLRGKELSAEKLRRFCLAGERNPRIATDLMFARPR